MTYLPKDGWLIPKMTPHGSLVTAKIAVDTVNATVTALEDLHDCLQGALKRAGDATEEELEMLADASDLVDKIKGGL